MKKMISILALGILLSLSFALQAEPIVIQLMEVIGMGTLPGDDPLDSPEQSQTNPPRPNDFIATIDAYNLSVIKQNDSITSAQATVVNASTGGIVINEQFTNSLQEQISNTGMYVLHIETAGGALVGQFIVQ